MIRTVPIALLLTACQTMSQGSGPSGGGAAGSAQTRVSGARESAGDDAGTEAPRLYVVAGAIDVMDVASSKGVSIGSVRAGGSVALAPPIESASTDTDCPEGWYRVVPHGFVCAGKQTTRDAGASALRVPKEYRISPHAALPATYGIAEITPLYLRLPTWDEQLRSEPGLEEHLHKRAALRATEGAARAWGDASMGHDAELEPVGIELPDDMRSGTLAPLGPKPLLPKSPVAGSFAAGAHVAWVAEFDSGGRAWLLTPELLFVPRDMVRRTLVSGFHGIEVPEGRGVVFSGRRPARRFRRDPTTKKFVAETEGFAPQTAVLLLEPLLETESVAFLESVEPGTYVRSDEVIAAVPTPPNRWGISADERWIELNAKLHVLFLREGQRVSFATLVSGGPEAERPGMRIGSKHLTLAAPFDRPRAALGKAEIPEVLIAADGGKGATTVAFFAAWWMTSWGSARGDLGFGLAPLDARRLFDFASPALPDGWHSVQGDGTRVVVHD